MFELKPTINALMRSKLGAVLLILQLAITLAIVSNAVSIIQDRMAYLNKETGYPEDDIFKFNSLNFDKQLDLLQQVELDEQSLRGITGVIDAVAISSVPLSGSGSSGGFQLKPEPQESKRSTMGYVTGDEHTLNTLGLSVSEGRDFNEADVVVIDESDARPSVVIVSRALSDELFGAGKGLGETIYWGADPLSIIGIVETMANQWPKSSFGEKAAIIPMIRVGNFQKYLVRTAPGSRAQVMRQIEELMLSSHRDRVVSDITGLDQKKARYDAKDVLMMRMLMTLIVVLVVVTALGIFGLSTFNISKRTKQIGTRRALGARKSAIVRYFVVENALICTVGLMLGSAAAVLLGQKLMQWYSVPALGYSFIVVTASLLLVMSLLSVLMPALRAANISPSIATRSV
ncbi:putative ABC transport system permease protein [Pseudoalteromonas rubra]|uniref:Putative ABC transport system permease protein n=1 Tax=Pseudoalteromonas rubra TaxID=43658 RepID=A0A8T0C166_9GAMM|nr:FtsX-like permease family protein [Pseudoalteromonas rubra]KAF7781675.1 putative ABC transport system permease protein [Pseudoalteromonas rubra]